jgi:hypothetical protein
MDNDASDHVHDTESGFHSERHPPLDLLLGSER